MALQRVVETDILSESFHHDWLIAKVLHYFMVKVSTDGLDLGRISSVISECISCDIFSDP